MILELLLCALVGQTSDLEDRVLRVWHLVMMVTIMMVMIVMVMMESVLAPC